MNRISRPQSDATAKSTRTDPELFVAMADGDVGALGILFDRYHDPVHQFLSRAATEMAEVDDLVQETFLTALRASSSYDGRDSAKPFLIGVAAQLVRRKRRTFARLRNMLHAFGRAPTESLRSPEESLSQRQDASTLHAAIARLSDERRIVLVMVEWNGMSGVEIAKALDLPVGTVWRRLHEARAQLRKAMERGAR